MEKRQWNVIRQVSVPYWVKGCPILLQEHSLLRAEDGSLFAHCVFQNNTGRTLNALYISVLCKDDHGADGEQWIDHSYLGLRVANGERFEDSAPFFLLDSECSQITIKLKKAVFEGDLTWQSPVPTLFSPVPSKDYFSSPDVLDEQYLGENLRPRQEEKPALAEALGALVPEQKKPDGWLDGAHPPIHWEKPRERKKLSRGKKLALIAGSCAGIAGLALAIGIPYYQNVMVPERHYQDAMLRLQAGDYEQAIDLFTQLDTYQDSTKLKKEAEQEEKYLQAQELWNSGQLEEAYQSFVRLGDFKDAAEQAKQVMYQYIEQLIEEEQWQTAFDLCNNMSLEPEFQELANRCVQANPFDLKLFFTNYPTAPNGKDYTKDCELFDDENKLHLYRGGSYQTVQKFYPDETIYLVYKTDGGLKNQSKSYRIMMDFPDESSMGTSIYCFSYDSDILFPFELVKADMEGTILFKLYDDYTGDLLMEYEIEVTYKPANIE